MKNLKITNTSEWAKERQHSLENPLDFWKTKADSFVWHQRGEKIQSGDFHQVNIKWFEGSTLNITENCLDRHLKERGDKSAITFIANDPQEAPLSLSYKELHQRVCQMTNALKKLEVKSGDVVAIYMGMTPEIMVATLACARLGATHCVVFGGFSSQALAERMRDGKAKLLITSDVIKRGDKTIDLKSMADQALVHCPDVKKVVVHNRDKSTKAPMKADRDIWWHELIKECSPDCPATVVEAEHPLFILYTSGSTGKPKGLLHTTAGYMLWAAYTYSNVFQMNEDDTFWCTADLGWITGHTYTTYAPLLCGHHTVLFEGVPTWPTPARFWQEVERLKVTHFYTAPTAIRALEAQGEKWPNSCDLSSLKVLGSVGEPINEEAWKWYHHFIGKERCPIVDTWWQTETGGIMISSLAGITEIVPTEATFPLPGIEAILVDQEGQELKLSGDHIEGNLCIKRPWPGMARSIFGDHERFIQTYFSTYKGLYFTGDGARLNKQGHFRISGRVDDVVNVSGHRIGTAEVEDVINEHRCVVESAVVGLPHSIKGQGLYAFVIPYPGQKKACEEELLKELNQLLTQKIGAIAKLEKLQLVGDLPKTRSGKIMRRILRKVSQGQKDQLGDTSTLLNPHIVDELRPFELS